MLLVIVYLLLMVEYCVAVVGNHNYTLRPNPEYVFGGLGTAGAGVTLGSGAQVQQGRNLLASRVTLGRLPLTTLPSNDSKMRNSTAIPKLGHASIFAKFRRHQACAAVLLRGTADVAGDLRRAPEFKRDLQACVQRTSAGADETASLYKFAEYIRLNPGSLGECEIGAVAESLPPLGPRLPKVTMDRNISASGNDHTLPLSPQGTHLLSHSLTNCSYFASLYPLWK